MRPGRLALLVGILLASAALYLKHLAVDAAAFGVLGGGSVPTIWQELGRWGRPAAVLLIAALVALAFRPVSGLLDRGGGLAAGLLAAGAVAGGVLARQAAAADAAVVSAALTRLVHQGGSASAGFGFWLLLGGTALAGVGVAWDLAAIRQGGSERGASRPSSGGEDDPAALQ